MKKCKITRDAILNAIKYDEDSMDTITVKRIIKGGNIYLRFSYAAKKPKSKAYTLNIYEVELFHKDVLHAAISDNDIMSMVKESLEGCTLLDYFKDRCNVEIELEA